jgi:hypothetical protein
MPGPGVIRNEVKAKSEEIWHLLLGSGQQRIEYLGPADITDEIQAVLWADVVDHAAGCEEGGNGQELVFALGAHQQQAASSKGFPPILLPLPGKVCTVRIALREELIPDRWATTGIIKAGEEMGANGSQGRQPPPRLASLTTLS